VVRQLIARIDDGLHTRLKRRAAVEGRSVNAMVSDILRRAVVTHDERELVRARMRALGRLVTVPRPRTVPSRRAMSRLTKGLGSSVSTALSEERRKR
jgi:plasmid stability protein